MAQQFVDMCRREKEATAPDVTSVVLRATAPTARDPRASAGRGPEGAGLVYLLNKAQVGNEASCKTAHTGVKVGPSLGPIVVPHYGDTPESQNQSPHDGGAEGAGRVHGRAGAGVGQHGDGPGAGELPSVEGIEAPHDGRPKACHPRRRGISQRGSGAAAGRWSIRRLSLRKRQETEVLPRGQSQIATRTLTEKATGGNVYIPSGAGNPINTARVQLSSDAPSAPSTGEAA